MLFESGEGIRRQASGWRQSGSLRKVLFPDKHVGELGAVRYHVAELADFAGRDEAWSYHVVHEKPQILRHPCGRPCSLSGVWYTWGAQG